MTTADKRRFSDRDLAALEGRVNREVTKRLTELRRVRDKTYEFRIEKQCRVCSDPDVRKLVNHLLSIGYSLDSVVECCAGFNVVRPKNRRITRDSVYNHKKRHYPLQEPARMIWRRMMEEQAEKEEKDWVSDVTSQVTAWAFMEVVGQKAWEKLIDEQTDVPIELGMQALIKLHEMRRKEAGDADVSEMMAQMNRIIAAVQEECSPEQRERIRRRLAGEEPTEVLDVDLADDEFSPDPDFDGDDL